MDEDEVIGAVDDLVDLGIDEEKAISIVVGFLDSIFPAVILIPGPAGIVLEAVDDKIFEGGLNLVVDGVEKLVQGIRKKLKEGGAAKNKRKILRRDKKAKREVRGSI